MKYTILGFQQQKLIEMNLDIEDALILRVLKDMYSSTKMEHIIINDDKYIWINQKYLNEQIPIIGSRSKLIRRIDNMVDLGLLEKVLKHEKNGQRGNYSYIKITSRLGNLEEYIPYVKMTQGLCQSDTRVMSKRHNKDSSIIDSSITNNKDIYSSAKAKQEIPYKEIIDYLNEKTNKKYKHTASGNKKLIKARWNEGYTLEDFKKVIDVKVEQWKNDNTMKQYLRPSTLFENKFDGYLNEESKTSNKKIPSQKIGVEF